jgi:rhamnosyltransferase
MDSLNTTNMQLLAAVITYYPDLKLLKQNLAAVMDSVDRILIWENTPEKDKYQYRLKTSDKIEYAGDGVNSISRGLNYSWEYAKKNGFDYLLLLDQDSVFENLDDYLHKTISHPAAPLGIWGPEINEQRVEHDYEMTETCITSGMLLPVEMIDKIGGWDELFRIDCVDFDFCLCASESGFYTYTVKGARLKQRFGNPQAILFRGQKKYVKNYPPVRLYTYYRDIFILKKKHPESLFVKNALKARLKKMKGILFYESEKFNKATAIVKGIVAGLTYSYKGESRK